MGKALYRPTARTSHVTRTWNLAEALETYGTKNWVKGYFGINELGNVVCTPDKNPERALDIKKLVDQPQDRGIQLPILLRFTDILKHRIGEIADCFKKTNTDASGRLQCRWQLESRRSRCNKRRDIGTGAWRNTNRRNVANSPRQHGCQCGWSCFFHYPSDGRRSRRTAH
jgi:hypothetical protein